MNDQEIQPFRIAIPDNEVSDLRDRLARTRWPEEPADTGWDRGVPLTYLRDLAGRWGGSYNWPEHEAALNRFPQFTTTIDGQTIHFLHVRSSAPNAMPLLLLHSWPGSPVEFERMIEPLVDPEAFGEAAEAFDVVVPSLPGFGFSTPLSDSGWTTGRIARAIVELMRRLGYERYLVHGGDIGAGVASGISTHGGAAVAGIHVTTDLPTAVTFAGWSGDPTANPALSEEQRERVVALKAASEDDEGYLKVQSTRPATIGYALADSPVGQLAWIVEKVRAWTDSEAELPEDAVDIDQLLTNVSLYWFSRSGASSAHVLYDGMHAQEWEAPGAAPVGFAVFGSDPIVRILIGQEHTGHWSEFERGGHFPAMEQPELLVGDLRRFAATVR